MLVWYAPVTLGGTFEPRRPCNPGPVQFAALTDEKRATVEACRIPAGFVFFGCARQPRGQTGAYSLARDGSFLSYLACGFRMHACVGTRAGHYRSGNQDVSDPAWALRRSLTAVPCQGYLILASSGFVLPDRITNWI